MNWAHWQAYLKRDGWLLAALLLCVTLCLGMSASGQSASTEEGRISRVLSQLDGAGQVEVAIHYDESLPCGAVVVADGAGDVSVQLRLVSAVTTLLGLDNSQVAVYPREGGR
ncbi:MAG: hypothetical protein IJ438_03350 [Clostridia bacterium]|nr:hypothetical protein [Clostridia bacterium]